MNRIENYRLWYEHEKASNAAMLKMIDSVSESARGDARYMRCLILADHLAACRANWLSMMAGGAEVMPWWEESVDRATLDGLYQRAEREWTDYLANLKEEELDKDFDFPLPEGGHWRWHIEGQIYQLLGHAHYHRGQIALLVDQLGGETVDTDFADWMPARDPGRWKYIP